MAFDSEKLASIAKQRSVDAESKSKERIKNRKWLKISREISMAVYAYLKDTGTTQKELAEKMGKKAPYIARLLKGQENLTLETISLLQETIGIELVTVYRPYHHVEQVSKVKHIKLGTYDVQSEKFYNIMSINPWYSPNTIHTA